MERNFYVDDGLISIPIEEKAIKLKTTQEMPSLSNLCLHKTASNKGEFMMGFPPEDLSKELKNLDLSTEFSPVQRSFGVSWDILIY